MDSSVNTVLSSQTLAAHPPMPARLDLTLPPVSQGEVLVVEGDLVLACTPDLGAQLGFPENRPFGHRVEQLPASLQPIIREAASLLKPVTRPRVLLESATGVLGPFQVRAVPVRLPTGKAHVTLILSEIATSEATERTIRKLDRLASVGTLSTGMAHEVKNALVAIRTFVELLLEKNQDAELAGIVRREMQRIERLVAQMLHFGAPASANVRPLAIHNTLNYSLQLVKHHLDERMIKLELEFDAASDVVPGDQDQLEQAFLNILLNGIEAIGTNGSLTVNTSQPVAGQLPPALAGRNGATFLCVSVRDTGVGVADENLGRLFEPFFTTKPNGTGLGLAITRKIVEEHYGLITLQSEPGAGSTFSIYLPHSSASSPESKV